jgi:hypothetical protein
MLEFQSKTGEIDERLEHCREYEINIIRSPFQYQSLQCNLRTLKVNLSGSLINLFTFQWKFTIVTSQWKLTIVNATLLQPGSFKMLTNTYFFFLLNIN